MKTLLCVLLAGMAAGQTTSATTNQILCADKNLKQVPCPLIANGYPNGCVEDQKWDAKTSMCMSRSVPAVRKTRQIRDDPSFVIVCGMAESLKLQGLMEHCLKTVKYWDCADPDRALIVSQNGKKAACYLLP